MSVALPARLNSKNFESALNARLSSSDDTFLRGALLRDHEEKLALSGGYPQWLDILLGYLKNAYGINGKSVLDLGSGSGEITVWMNKLGYDAKGAELEPRALDLSRILAAENGLDPKKTFINLADGKGRLPFDDAAFDIVTMFSVLEHVDDVTLVNMLIPELARICRGAVFILVPNKLKPVDDHTGLKFVPFLPREWAAAYIKLRGAKYRYFISASGEWDVYYRTWGNIKSLFKKRFRPEFVPKETMFPKGRSIFLGKRLSFGTRQLRFGLSFPDKLISRITGAAEESFYEYLNFAAVPLRPDA